MTLLDRFLAGDRVALAKVISFVEDRSEGYDQLLARIFSGGRRAYRVGLTGPPGAGKSSLVNRLAVLLSDQNLKVGIIAVDPTSPFSGGALLGDRVRMQALYGRQNIFIRSMATRGSSGGLAAATKDVCVVLEGFGFDVILVETVGVGQIELDVASVCDSVVVVFVPESGDSIQAMKSGLMEIADVFCLNKSDRPGAERIKAELESILDVQRQVRSTSRGASSAPWEIPVMQTVAIRDTGISELWSAVERHRLYRNQADPAGYRSVRARSDLVLTLTELANDQLEKTLFDTDHLDRAVEQIVSGHADPYSIARQLFETWRRGRT
jgi:LAO/AO transport system kinase